MLTEDFVHVLQPKLSSMLLWLLHYLHQLQYCWMLSLQVICPVGHSLLQHQHLLDLEHPNP